MSQCGKQEVLEEKFRQAFARLNKLAGAPDSSKISMQRIFPRGIHALAGKDVPLAETLGALALAQFSIVTWLGAEVNFALSVQLAPSYPMGCVDHVTFCPIAEKNVVLVGEPYRARIHMATDGRIEDYPGEYEMYVGDKKIPADANGGYYEVFPRKAGSYKYKPTVTLHIPGGSSRYYEGVETGYEVVKPSAVLLQEHNEVFYAGADFVFTVFTSSPEGLRVTTDNGTIRRLGEQYYLRPATPGRARVTVMGTTWSDGYMPERKWVKYCEQEYTVLAAPKNNKP